MPVNGGGSKAREANNINNESDSWQDSKNKKQFWHPIVNRRA